MIYFFVGNNDGIGGMQNLYLSISNELSNQGIESKIIANLNSYIANELILSNKSSLLINLKSCETFLKSFDLKDDVIVISGNISGLELIKNLNARILIWNVFPESLMYSSRIRRIHFKNLTRKLLIYLHSHSSIVFMDKFCFDTNNKIYDMNYKDGNIIVPVPIITKENSFLKGSHSDKKSIKLTYLGRASNFKFYPVLRLVQDLIKMNSETDLNHSLVIITDNPEEFKQKFKDYSGKVEISYQKNLVSDNLDEFLKNNSDIHFGMGLSCLEGAKLGIPSIMLDYGYSEFPDNYEYRWLYKVSGYILGENISTLKFNGLNNLKSIIEEFSINKAEISENTFNYVLKYHSIKPITEKFLSFVRKSNGRLTEFYNMCLANKPLVRFINSSAWKLKE